MIFVLCSTSLNLRLLMLVRWIWCSDNDFKFVPRYVALIYLYTFLCNSLLKEVAYLILIWRSEKKRIIYIQPQLKDVSRQSSAMQNQIFLYFYCAQEDKEGVFAIGRASSYRSAREPWLFEEKHLHGTLLFLFRLFAFQLKFTKENQNGNIDHTHSAW